MCSVSGYPDTDELEPSNCFSSDFASDTCDNVQTPFTYTINSGSSYPAEGFCIVRNTSHDGITGESYQFSAALCASNGGFGGGIFFNFQDEYNYDTFYTMRFVDIESPLDTNSKIYNFNLFLLKAIELLILL